jgi:uncharacterized Zn-binding protein involved in type VI secretion
MAGKPQFVATVASGTDITPGNGVEGYNRLAPHGQGFVMATPSKVICEGIPVAKVGDPVSPHGNFDNPRLPGFNPECGKAVIVEGSATVIVEGKPMAVAGPLGSLCSCGHWIQVPRAERTTAAGI